MHLLAIFSGLAGFCGLLLLVGVVWMLAGGGATTRPQREHVGRKIKGEQIVEAGKPQFVQKTAIKGKTSSSSREVAISFNDIKSRIRAGQWQPFLPILLALGGFLGLLLFGSLALLVALDDKLIGGFMALTVTYSVVRVLIGIIRA